jgi:hypothetical protein
MRFGLSAPVKGQTFIRLPFIRKQMPTPCMCNWLTRQYALGGLQETKAICGLIVLSARLRSPTLMLSWSDFVRNICACSWQIDGLTNRCTRTAAALFRPTPTVSPGAPLMLNHVCQRRSVTSSVGPLERTAMKVRKFLTLSAAVVVVVAIWLYRLSTPPSISLALNLTGLLRVLRPDSLA